MTISGFVSRSHGAIAPFTLSRPTTVAEAVARLEAGARCHAGGIDVVADLRHGRTERELVHLTGIDELRRIEVAGATISIGAAVTHHQIESSSALATHRPDLVAAWRTVGNVRVRRAGTIGGNLMARDPGYDAAPILAAAGARLRWADGQSSVAERPSGRLLVAVELPLQGRVLFDRSLKPVISVALGPEVVAIGCAHEDLVIVERPISVDSVGPWADQLPPSLDDALGSAAYRRRMAAVLLERLLELDR